MPWARYVACMVATKNVQKILVENMKGRDNLRDIGIG
jgi:hypothetical protein